jgi:hypothetical protein
MSPQLATSCNLFEVRVTDLNSQSGVVVTVGVSHPGTSAGTPMTAAACVVLQAHVAFRFRGGHFRVYLPGLQGNLLSDLNTLNPVPAAALLAAWTGMLSDIANAPPVGVGAMSQIAWHTHSSNPADFPSGHPTTKPPWPLATPVPHPITGWSFNPQLGSQRRRNQQP